MPEYIPPQEEMIKACAKEICERLAERHQNDVYRESVAGFTAFLTLASRVMAKHLTELE